MAIIPPTDVPAIRSKRVASGAPMRSSISARRQIVYKPRYPPPLRLSI
jgi:hypothetical protein